MGSHNNTFLQLNQYLQFCINGVFYLTKRKGLHYHLTIFLIIFFIFMTPFEYPVKFDFFNLQYGNFCSINTKILQLNNSTFPAPKHALNLEKSIQVTHIIAIDASGSLAKCLGITLLSFPAACFYQKVLSLLVSQ